MTAALHRPPPVLPAPRPRHLAVVRAPSDRVVCRTVPGAVAAVDLPAPGALVAVDPGVRVALHGVDGALRTRLLSEHWVQVDPALHEPDIAVVLTADPGRVRALHRARPRVAVLAVVPDAADAAAVLALLGAGADACVRGACSREVTAHLVAMTRRLAASR